MKTCTRCNKTLPISDFPANRKDNWCKKCLYEYNKAYKKAKKDGTLDEFKSANRRCYAQKHNEYILCAYCNQVLHRSQFSDSNLKLSLYICNNCNELYKIEVKDFIMSEYMNQIYNNDPQVRDPEVIFNSSTNS